MEPINPWLLCKGRIQSDARFCLYDLDKAQAVGSYPYLSLSNIVNEIRDRFQNAVLLFYYYFEPSEHSLQGSMDNFRKIIRRKQLRLLGVSEIVSSPTAMEEDDEDALPPSNYGDGI